MVMVPVLQAKFHFVEEKELGGAFTLGEHPALTWDALRDNTYQPALERYLEERIGFKSFLIRLHNQIAFSLFRVPGSSDIRIGRNDVLFEPRHIQAYAGQDLLSEAEVRFRVQRLRTVQRDLSRRGVHLLFVMAPNKARFEPENLPAALRPAPGTPTNYERYARALQADTVAWIDMVALFAQWKKTKPYPLFPRGGTHWSGYGATLAADTLLRRLEQMSGLRLPTVRTIGPPRIIRATDSLQATDNDLAKPLNLLQQVEASPLAYPQLAFDQPQPGQTRPPALFVADSFIWGLVHFGPYLQNEFSDDTRVWYYGSGVHMPNDPWGEIDAAHNLDLRQQVESRRFIVVLLTEHNLPTYEFNFTNNVYRLYHPLTAADNAAIDQIAKELVQAAADKDADAAWAERAKDENAYLARMREKAEAQYEKRL